MDKIQMMNREEITRKSLVPRPFRSAKLAEAERVSDAIRSLCTTLAPGDRLPKHAELMEQFDASERVVLRVLDEFVRAGKIIRRSGAGTFVANQDWGVRKVSPVTEHAASNTLVVMSQPDNSFFSRCGDLLLRHAEIFGLSVVYQPVSMEKIEAYTAPDTGNSTMGYIVLGSHLIPVAERLVEAGHRVVAIADPDVSGIPAQEHRVNCVHVDNVQGSYLAANHLIELGHRRIVMAMVDENYTQGPRWDGYTLALREAKMSGINIPAEALLESTVKTWDADPALAAEYFAQPDRPTGLCVWNDRVAIRLMMILLRAGVSVPDQVSLVGYDNLPDDIEVSPQLTTVDQSIDQQIRIALRLLTQVTRPVHSNKTLVTPILVVRDSTCAPKQS